MNEHFFFKPGDKVERTDDFLSACADQITRTVLRVEGEMVVVLQEGIYRHGVERTLHAESLRHVTPKDIKR